MSAAIDIKTLSEIQKMLKELKNDIVEIKKYIKPEYDLTTRAGVMAYLDISSNTITRYVSEGEFREGYHYHRELKNNVSRIIFVSGAIEEYKRENPKKDKTK